MERLNGKVAFITGGNSGIGLATARLFIAEGAKVVITGRNESKLAAAVEELGVNSFAVRMDTSDPASMDAAVAAAIDKFGKLDVIFANAGIAGSTPLGKTTMEAFDEIMKTNVTGAFFTVQAALPQLKSGASVILNGSVLASLGLSGNAAYAASKGAVRSMVRALASELSPRGIRVNMVVPGATVTPIWGETTGDALTKLEASLAPSIPLNRMGNPDEIANAVLFLASDESSFVHGTEIVVDGGATSSPMGAPIYRQEVAG
ncbi:glucose 1-dehydrogenase [Cohnella lupini]|uniref:NAD(P)-dependent dehydrogenase (Short-subunit alcohol dehydrogenase family) n=1 Tax=Cohnella lupini TaxID=1294267 RepID=A0A3D9IC97_9BACL|nr:glucose 1-dehydrogenase [Cohnella lupini]RED59297.1 NAD(P)-dependent dehydrogenase (short-subunit alcohol dehydrogenase family) [Cohnella lupini]